MANITFSYIDQYIEDLTEDRDFLDLRLYARENEVPIMKVPTKEFLKTLILIKKPKAILEIGTAIGYSSLVFAKYSKAKVTTIELSKEMADLAGENFRKYNEDIKLINEDGRKALNNLNQGFDFVFIDANKAHYRDYFDRSLELLNPSGLIVCDNVLFRGEVANDDLIERRKITIVKRLRNFLAYITDLEGVESSILPIGDGLSISVKVN